MPRIAAGLKANSPKDGDAKATESYRLMSESGVRVNMPIGTNTWAPSHDLLAAKPAARDKQNIGYADRRSLVEHRFLTLAIQFRRGMRHAG